MLKKTFIFLLAGIIIPGCSSLKNDFRVENDVVYSSKRIRIESIYTSQEWNTPMKSLKQTIIKEISNDTVFSIRFYETMYLVESSFNIDNKVFIIIDKEIFPVNFDSFETNIVSDVSENSKEILTGDSTKVSVVTGYKQSKSRINWLSYTIDSKIMERIRTSHLILFRYYCGPDMITIKHEGKQLDRLKKLIDIN
jgi:hypothetical protein